jgi:CTD kinase subunit beta
MPKGEDDEREKVTQVVWSTLTDLYRTFAPLKQTAATMALASLELAAHLVTSSSPNNISAIRDELQQYDIGIFSTSREEIMETILDALDMYTQHTASTILGMKYSLDDFLRIRLAFNKECNEKNLPRHTIAQTANTASNGSTLRVANGHPTPVSPPQPETQTQQLNGTQQTPEGGGTVRFVLNPQLAAEEKVEVQKYFVEEWEEYEEEVEVPTPRPAEQTPKDSSRSERSEKGTPRAKDANDSDRDRPKDREREIERDRARIRERERERDRPRNGRFEDRRYEDRFDDRERRYDDRRDRRYEERRYDDDRRRREDRR